MKKKINLMIVALLVITLSSTAKVLKAEVVTINSGVDAITFLKASGGSFDHIFTESDFSSSRVGQSAYIVPSYLIPGWIPDGSTSPDALWINCNEGPAPGSALYAIPFSLTETQNVNLDFRWAIDNGLGDPINSGLFVNGTAVSGKNSAYSAEFYSVHQLLNIDITPYVIPGLNYLYVYQYDLGAASGSQFTAVVTATPEPATLLLFGLGGLLVMRRQKR